MFDEGDRRFFFFKVIKDKLKTDLGSSHWQTDRCNLSKSHRTRYYFLWFHIIFLKHLQMAIVLCQNFTRWFLFCEQLFSWKSLFPSVVFPLFHNALFPRDPGGRGVIRLPLIIVAHASERHQPGGECVSSWIPLTLVEFSPCHLAFVSCSPGCSVTSVPCKLLKGTNSEKPELWVTDGWETSELTAMNAQRQAVLRGNKTQRWLPVCDNVWKLIRALFAQGCTHGHKSEQRWEQDVSYF